MVTLDAIRGPVAQELEEFDAFVRRNFKVENELLSGMVDYILSSRGKGVRPLLVLLSAALNAPAGGRGIGQRTYLAAMLVEILHTASLTPNLLSLYSQADLNCRPLHYQCSALTN